MMQFHIVTPLRDFVDIFDSLLFSAEFLLNWEYKGGISFWNVGFVFLIRGSGGDEIHAVGVG